MVCNSISSLGLSNDEAKRIEAKGHDCITNPEKFLKNCNDWRKNWSFLERGSINDTVKFIGCYKVETFFEYNVWGKSSQGLQSWTESNKFISQFLIN